MTYSGHIGIGSTEDFYSQEVQVERRGNKNHAKLVPLRKKTTEWYGVVEKVYSKSNGVYIYLQERMDRFSPCYITISQAEFRRISHGTRSAQEGMRFTWSFYTDQAGNETNELVIERKRLIKSQTKDNELEKEAFMQLFSAE